ncbi:MAG: hypothetical protein C0402_01125 [Thermodesulfovibrio sp.]|nr:hypothetical protein [Thermodesulfovibrio sp.]
MLKTILTYIVLSLVSFGIISPELQAQSYDSLKAALASPRKATGLIIREKDARLKKLPPDIKKLGNLRSLQISCPAQLEGLPPEIGSLSRLERLVIDNNDKCQTRLILPETIGKLKNLKVLRLHGTLEVPGIEPGKAAKGRADESLPKSFSQLNNLQELDLGHNGLTEVPPKIAAFEKLEKLMLDDNPLTDVPPFMAKLKKLKELSLNATRVTTLPKEFTAVRGLKVAMSGKTLTLQDQVKLRTDFPHITFNFGENRAETPVKTTAPPAKKVTAVQEPNYRIIFTTGLNENNEPTNNLTELSLDEKIVYIYVTWYSLPRETYQYVCKIYDGAGDLVRLATMDFTPSDESHYTFSSYQIRKLLDKPGAWKFEIYLNGVRVVDKSLKVVSN